MPINLKHTGAGTLTLKSGANSVTETPGSFDSQTVADAGTYNWDWSANESVWLTLTPNMMTSTATFTFDNKTARQKRTMLLNIGAGMAASITWPTITWEGGSAPSSWTASKFYEIQFWYDGTTVYGRRLTEWG